MESKTVHKNEEGNQQRKKKSETERGKASRKDKQESAESSRDKSRVKGSPFFK